jgi:hypothetical protein
MNYVQLRTGLQGYVDGRPGGEGRILGALAGQQDLRGGKVIL